MISREQVLREISSLTDKRKHIEAIAICKKAIKEQKENYVYYKLLGDLSIQVKSYEEAIESYIYYLTKVNDKRKVDNLFGKIKKMEKVGGGKYISLFVRRMQEELHKDKITSKEVANEIIEKINKKEDNVLELPFVLQEIIEENINLETVDEQIEKVESNRFRYRQTVGIKNGLVVKGSEEEKDITSLFSEHFGITFSKQGRFKTTDYTIAFLQPNQKLQESFNMFNEVLLLFSPYEVFEKRVLDFVDKTLLEYDNRLDKVCIFVISQDKRIEEVVKNINKENKDSKIIVPFTYSELSTKELSSESLHNRLRKFFYNRDLFALESPLKTDAYFFGRKDIVQLFYDKYSIGEQAGLFGLRKIGKTSVLFALERMIKLRGGYSVYLDCQNPSVHQSEWNELLLHIIKEVIEKYELNIEVNENNYSARSAAAAFEKDFVKINGELKRRVLIIFDEIENISFNISPSTPWKGGDSFLNFWQTIRSIYHKNSEIFSFIITGVNPMCVETISIDGYDNPIFGMLNPKYLNLFSIQDVKVMIDNIGKYMGLRFEEEIFSKLTDEYGGHPFLIRHICSLIHNSIQIERPYTVTKYEYSKRKEEYNRQIYSYIKLILQILERWYSREYKLLEILACEGEAVFKGRIHQCDNEIEHLMGYGILKKVNNDYFITIDAVAKYLQESYSAKQKPSTVEEAWQKICVTRNNLEIRLRKLIITTLNVQYGKGKVKEKILEAIEGGRREKLRDKELNDIIENNLFLLDCKQIICKNWNIFDKFFGDKAKFETFLDNINYYRIDAHAKTISEDDYGILMIAFKWFDNIMENID